MQNKTDSKSLVKIPVVSFMMVPEVRLSLEDFMGGGKEGRGLERF